MTKDTKANCHICKISNINEIYKQPMSCDICVELKVDSYKDYLTGDTRELFSSIICYEDFDFSERKKLGLNPLDDNRKKRVSWIIKELETIDIEKVMLEYKKGLLDEQANTLH